MTGARSSPRGQGRLKNHLITEKDLETINHVFDAFEENGAAVFDEMSKKYGKKLVTTAYFAFMSQKFGGRRQGASMIRQSHVYAAA